MIRPLPPTLAGALLAGAALFGCASEKPAEPGAAPTAEAPAAATADPPPGAKAEAPAPPTTPAPDARTAAQFAAEWTRVRQVPVEQQGTAGKALRDAWHGRIYTWTGYAVPGLCMKGTRSCAMHVFERRATPPEARLDGYFPQVVFTEASYAALEAACKGKSGCVVTFRGTLSEAETDPAEPLKLRFTEAAFVEGRDPAPDEQWFGRRAGNSAPKRVPNAKLRTGKPLDSALKPIRQTF